MQTVVVRGERRRRWAVVLIAVALLGVLPAAVSARGVDSPAVAPEVLRQRITGSAGQPFQGYAQSTGALGLPALPRLAQVSTLFSTTTRMRAWYAARDSWRVDMLGTGTELGVYQTPEAQWQWDYAQNQLTEVVGEPPVRLPRAADLTPPELGRRLVALAAGEPVTSLPARRVAGIAAAGLRIVPAGGQTTVAHVDVWSDARSGLPVQVEVTARGGQRPAFVTRFLEVALTAPPAGVVRPPAHRPDMGMSVTDSPDILGALERWGRGRLPARLDGRARGAAVRGTAAVGVYGTGLGQLVALAVPGRFGRQAFDDAALVGRRFSVPGGEAVVISTGLLSVLVVRAARTYLAAGLVDPAVLDRAAVELAGTA